MINIKLWKFVSQLCDSAEFALWTALLILVISFLTVVLPKLPAMRAQIEAMRTQEIAAENASYCTKLGMKAGTQTYDDCLIYLGDFRLKVERRISAEELF